MPHLARIALYPFKSLDGVMVQSANILASGALEHDREYACFDRQGKVVNGKRFAQIHQLRSQCSNDYQTLTLQAPHTEPQTFHIEQERSDLEAWLSDFFQFDIQVQQNSALGFPDDTDSPGPTLISTATLEAVAAWYPDLTVTELRRRLRTNLEIGGVPAFWEDQLFADAKHLVQFQIGSVVLEGVNPCQRCIVPTRDSQSGVATPKFQKTFLHNRKQTLPDWVNLARFNHFYRLAVNTRIPKDQDSVLTQGDIIRINGIVSNTELTP
ncbi:MOSC domain-containing protein [Acaryochloris sp. CCMEE 5410]|uniref:MOSC domain-containing protein n=1 Tax=Acaryochloris sp. CCMEE 5410 TaxID=310037 RepID=UPI00024839EF|nr:MOSC N-terminal beta barrel domain-containing protein [Acaryochloris sp. CCMEE 5410]KAI9134618.1 MOSC N-terminal beta barrel domain-containing protein [Acaryochloris sp. CCMEE 5410]